MYAHVSHLAASSAPTRTLCGEPWQGWQAPEGLPPDSVELPPHEPPGEHEGMRQCGACAKIIREVGLPVGVPRDL